MRPDRRALWIALCVSLLANLFLAGVVAGRMIARPPAAAGGFAPMREVRRLPADERTAFVAVMRAHRDAIRPARQAVRRARAQVEADVAAPVYDKARVDADFSALREASTTLQAQTQAALSEALGRLSPASRAAATARARGVGNAAPAR